MFLFGTRLTNVTRALRARDPDEALFCSEYVAHCFYAAGAPLAQGTNHHAVTPDQISKSELHENQGRIHWDPEAREAALAKGIASFSTEPH